MGFLRSCYSPTDKLHKSLSFKNKSLNEKYRKSKRSFQSLNYRFLCLTLLVFLLSHYLSNSLDLEVLNVKYFIPFLIGVSILAFGQFVITRVVKDKAEIAYTITVICFVVGAGEFSLNVLDNSKWSLGLYWILGVHLQTASLFLIITRVNWMLCSSVLILIQTYMWFILRRSNSNALTFTPSLIISLVYVVLLPLLSYTGEYEDKKIFLEMQQREENLRAFEILIKEVFPSSIVIFDKDKIRFFNSKIKEMFGITNESELISLLMTIEVLVQSSSQMKLKNNDDIELHSINLYEVVGQWRSMMTTNKAIFKSFEYFEAKHFSFKGKIEHTYTVQIGYTIWEGSPSTMIILNEISALKNYYKDLAEHKDHLLSTVSHELRTPLNGILGMAEMSKEISRDQAVRENLDVIHLSSKLLLNMINDILDFSLMSNKKLKLNIERTNIITLLEETIKLMEIQANMKNLKISLEQKVDNLIIKTDVNRLRQVLLNLIRNAVKFTEKGKIVVRVKESFQRDIIINQNFSVSKVESVRDFNNESESFIDLFEGDKMRRYSIEVEDSGIGIDKDDQQSIFKLYGNKPGLKRHDNNKMGVGLGLSISQSLVKILNQANGFNEEIKVDSNPGVGSRFYFDLWVYSRNNDYSTEGFPLCSMKEPVVSRPISLALSTNIRFTQIESTARSLLDREEIRALAVDDDQINLIVIRNYTLNPGVPDLNFSLSTAINGKQALDIVNDKRNQGYFFDVILMDCNMPIMDGYEASRNLRNMMFEGIIPEAPIIAITANVTSNDKQKCFENGMDYFLSKPVKKPELMAIIEKALRVDKRVKSKTRFMKND